jgi:hypothetical protein
LLVARPAIAEAPQSNSKEINPPYGPLSTAIIPPKIRQITQIQTSGRHSTRAERTITEGELADFLKRHGSPLELSARQILTSPHWSTIIGICWIEQYHCTKAPGNNYWGIMAGKGHLAQYATLSDGIDAISSLLVRYEVRGKDTIEELNGYYVQPASQNWFNTVLKTKQLVENL